ncbi:5' nucleotidase, NT5C type [Paenibacillus durus]|uniref:5' nucleotidase, NT5C type n=1 Tax=Paenibacillus durus TaxID=44251 RepID=UPI0004B31E25|nr:hypothetical protein [Paenibacillus durus]
MKDSQEVIRSLSERFEIYITTAAMEFPSSFTAKYEWLREHFDFLSDMNPGAYRLQKGCCPDRYLGLSG